MSKSCVAVLTLLGAVSSAQAGELAAAKAKEPAAAVPQANPNLIYQKNVFDAQRRAWELPPPPPPPQPPPPPALTDKDVKVQGVLINGSARKAIVEVAAGAMRLLPPPMPGKPLRPYKVLAEGEYLGEYKLVEIGAKELVFENGGVRAPLPFTIAKNRAVSGVAIPPPAQVAIVMPAAMPTLMDGSGGDMSSSMPTPFTPEMMPPPPPPVSTPEASASAVPPDSSAGSSPPQRGMTLIEAIEAARRNGVANSGPNPFANK
ncbi:hypothetical protein [Parachitinimonas caeni]|uniref:Uncharacterized protein n=1 Tax=Parachitinimonas caeni TaxID=3031301 RepID=A0ABT7DS34_9NEIS|nr:hypothetical protein [Parachitinimonas caeni]MDK2122878.1 hypothetical protein [Parachitinimonas caeni]